MKQVLLGILAVSSMAVQAETEYVHKTLKKIEQYRVPCNFIALLAFRSDDIVKYEAQYHEQTCSDETGLTFAEALRAEQVREAKIQQILNPPGEMLIKRK